ncbi:MAG: hypothetical protein GC160_12630 [Acidobacteria bacterium]|nr:hypothetical protein [Acidobacteriota bacterium]
MATATSTDLQPRIDEARARLDAHVREIVQWHFSPETGCEFWLNRAKELGFDPREQVHGYDDLKKLGMFQDEWLRGGPVRKWVPKGLAHKPVYVFETGGTTGVPKTRINIDDFRTDYSDFSKTLPDEFFPPGSDWLQLGPTGPRRLRLAIEHLAQERGGICFGIDLDPRWVVKLLKRGEMEEVERYKKHCIDQAITILGAHPNIKCVFTTPKLLEALCERISLKKHGITGVFCGGTEMTPQFHRFAVEELLEGAYFAATYGNTLMGLACHKPFDPADNYAIIYFSPQPRAVTQVVNPDAMDEEVGYGETGRVLLTTLTKEFFMPRFPERDMCEREPPCEAYPWDGVRNVRPFTTAKSGAVTVGVY